MRDAKNYKVLVVDDEDYIRESIEIILRTEGFEVFSVNSGPKALQVLQEKNVDVVLTDIKMPEMDGVTLLKKIKGEYQVEVILITGFPSLDTAVESVKFGAYDYITKPFKVEDLLNKILKAIENKKLKKEVVELNQIISIYDSSKFFANIMHVDEIFEKMNTIISDFLKNDGYFIRLFTREYIKDVNVDKNLNKFITDNFSYKDALTIFSNLEHYETTVKLNGKDINLLLLPMKSREGLWGIVGVFREGSRSYSDLDCKVHSIYVDQFSLSLLNIYSFEDLSKGYLETITALSKAVDAKDHYTMGHSENVKRYSLMIVEEMGLNEEFKDAMIYAGLLHDIGKIGVPTEIIVKPDRLTNEEYEEMKKHPIHGKDILSPIEFLGDVPYYVLYHHEKLDGSGYPYGLTAEDIPLGAKILHVADSYDAMTTDRSYRMRRDPKLAFEELDRCTGTQFDREIVAAFKSAMRKKGNK
jgi:response regulator RpfG family c-di-GMP phosphodiesterase